MNFTGMNGRIILTVGKFSTIFYRDFRELVVHFSGKQSSKKSVQTEFFDEYDEMFTISSFHDLHQ